MSKPTPCCQPKTSFLIILSLFVIAAAVFTVTNVGKKTSQTLRPTPTPAHVEPFPTFENPNRPTPPVDTSSWQTYQNEKYGFEFQYPPTVKPSLRAGPVLLALGLDPFYVNVWYSNGKNLSNWLTENKEIPLFNNNLSTHIQKSDQLVDGLPAIKITDPANGGQDTIYVASGKYIYSISYIITEETNQSEYEKTVTDFNLILSTFKFTQ